MSLTPSVLLKPPAPAPHGKEPPGSPPDTPFAAVLDDHQARTAVAEGQQSGETPAASVAERDAHAPARHAGDRDDKRASGGKQDGRSTGALAALLGGLPPAPVVASALVARLPAAPVAQESGAPVLPTAAQAKALPPLLAAIPTGPAVPAAASALPLGPGAKGAAAPTVAGAQTAAEVAAAPTGAQQDVPAPALPSALTAVARALRAPAAPTAPTAATRAPAAPPAATAPAARAAPGAPASGHAAPQAAAPSVAPAPLSATAPAPDAQATDPAGAAEAARGVGLEHAIETVRLALRAAADGGITHARISLTPRELGSIEVHLRQTADGLVARVVAQHAAAAQLLQEHGGDLRRQLEQSGVTLLRLDIGASGEQGGQAAGRQALADGGGTGRGDTSADDTSAPLDGATETTATATLALPNGALVNVLA